MSPEDLLEWIRGSTIFVGGRPGRGAKTCILSPIPVFFTATSARAAAALLEGIASSISASRGIERLSAAAMLSRNTRCRGGFGPSSESSAMARIASVVRKIPQLSTKARQSSRSRFIARRAPTS